MKAKDVKISRKQDLDKVDVTITLPSGKTAQFSVSEERILVYSTSTIPKFCFGGLGHAIVTAVYDEETSLDDEAEGKVCAVEFTRVRES